MILPCHGHRSGWVDGGGEAVAEMAGGETGAGAGAMLGGVPSPAQWGCGISKGWRRSGFVDTKRDKYPVLRNQMGMWSMGYMHSHTGAERDPPLQRQKRITVTIWKPKPTEKKREN